MKKSNITSFREKYAFLSNFWYCELWWEGKLYRSSEHAYQASKTLDDEEREWIRTTSTPGKAKRRGRKVTLREDWEKVKLPIMEALLERKFANPERKEMLLATGDAELIESNNWHDSYWGVCNGKGQNWLGKLLMKIREELKEKTDSKKNNH